MRLPVELTRKLILSEVPLLLALDKLDTGNSYAVGRTCLCPFHDNTDTPAATIYSGENHDSLWCFKEHKMYTSVDVIEKLLHKDVYTLAEAIWSRLSEAEQSEFLSRHQKEDLQHIFALDVSKESTDKTNVLYAMYKANKIGNKELLSKIVDIYLNSAGD